MVYLFCLAVNYCALCFSQGTTRRKGLVILTLLILGFFTMARGRVGTDTALTYEPMVQHLSDVEGTEPLFLAILHVLKPLFPTALTTVTIGLGAVFTCLLLVYTLRADGDELFLLQAFLIPTQYLGMSVSGQRAGIAFAFLLLASQSLALRQRRATTGLVFAATLTHYSTILWLLLWWLNARGVKHRSQWLAIASGLGLVAGIAFMARDYLLIKLVLYFESDYDRPNPWSGVSVVLLCLLVLAAAAKSELPVRDKKRLWIITLCALIACMVIGLYTIAALRLIGIVELSLIYGVLSLHQRAKLRMTPQLRRYLVCIGLLAVIFLIRNVRQELLDPPSSSPILPYRFLWEETFS